MMQRMRKVLWGFLVVSALFLGGGHVQIVRAGVCGDTARIDWYNCVLAQDMGGNNYCRLDYMDQRTVSCDTSTCMTMYGVCSSNDTGSCTLANNCQMSPCSPVSCNASDEGGGYVPTWVGYHDGQFGGQTSTTCTANGWITDINKPSRDINIHIYSDGAEIYSGYASDFRNDLTSYCTDGTCAFNVDLSGLISLGVEHNILIKVGVAHVLPDSGSPPRGLLDRKINCVETPPANTAPTGTLTCPGSPMCLGNSASFSLHGSDVEGNLSRAELWRSPASPVNPGGDWTAINASIPCTGASCNPLEVSWSIRRC